MRLYSLVLCEFYNYELSLILILYYYHNNYYLLRFI